MRNPLARVSLRAPSWPDRRTARRAFRSSAVLATAVLVLAGCGSSSSGSSSGNSGSDSLKIAFVAVSGNQAALAWAKEKGYFEKAGIDVDVQVLGTGTNPALVGGRVDLTLASPGYYLGIADKGKPVKIVFQNDVSPTVAVAAKPSIKSVTDCHTMSTGAPGTNARAVTALLETTFGVKWTPIELPDPSTFTPTVVTGRADCGVGPEILYRTAEEQGKLHVIFSSTDKSTLPPGWPTEGGPSQAIGGLAKSVEEKGDTISKFLQVYLKAIKDFRDGSTAEEAQTLISNNKDWATYNLTSLEADIDAQKPGLAPSDGYLSEEAWKNTLDYQAGGGLDFVKSGDSKFNYTNMVDMSYYDKGIGKPAGE